MISLVYLFLSHFSINTKYGSDKCIKFNINEILEISLKFVKFKFQLN